MKKKPFQVGDRVRVYGSNVIAALNLGRDTLVFDGVVKSKCRNPDWINIELTKVPGRIFPFHKKQCRRLVKKKRREIFIYMEPFTYNYTNKEECLAAARKNGGVKVLRVRVMEEVSV